MSYAGDSAMKVSRPDLKRKILLTLDQGPSSIYDLLYSMDNFSDPKRTRLPKLLKTMEEEKLVVSAMQPGPLGPYRRIYQPGPHAEEYLIETLRGGFETLLHFYNKYRQSHPGHLYSSDSEFVSEIPKGDILYIGYPTIAVEDMDEIRNLVTKHNISLSILKADTMLEKTGINYNVLDFENQELTARDESFSEVKIRGVPNRNDLPVLISECKRVLRRKGRLSLRVPYAFFEEPTKASLTEFIRITAETLFPDLGLVEGYEVNEIIAKNFGRHGFYETNLGEIVFWGIR